MPTVVRWPGVIKPGTVINEIMSHEDWLPTFVAAAGDPDVKTKLLAGMQAGDKTFKIHLDGYNFLPLFKGETASGPRHEIFYFDMAPTSMRYVTTTGRLRSNCSRGISSTASAYLPTCRWS